MKIECPTCHLTGNVNELEIPQEGRHVNCPRCKAGFLVNKPPAAGWNPSMIRVCPACQYSTFTGEMFDVCPKCGQVESAFQEKRGKSLEVGQLQRDQEVRQRSCRNPDLAPPSEASSEQEQAQIPLPVQVAGWVCVAAAGALLFYGLSGLFRYYGKDWQAILSETTLEPVSGVGVFFRLGFLPWLISLYSSYMLVVSSQFLRLRAWARKGIEGGAWAGLVVGIIHEVADLILWIRNSSSSPSFSYYAIGVVSALFMIILWCAPFLALLWFVRSEAITKEFPEG